MSRVSVDAIGTELAALAGRFVLMRADVDDICLWHDTCGLRTIYYTRHDGSVLAASQPSLFGYVRPLREAPHAETYWRSNHVATNGQHWLPSGVSLYEGVSHLTPNHYLRGSTLEAVRYWPTRPMALKPARAVSDDASMMLQRLIAAAAKRWPLELPLTAGWDSRTLLAASRNIAPALCLSTMKFHGFTAQTPDLRIPAQICATLGLTHRVQDCQIAVPDEFAALWKQHTAMAHGELAAMAYGVSRAGVSERVPVNGNCAEIARCYYYSNGVHAPIRSGDDLVRLVGGWSDLDFVRERMSDWYRSTAPIATACGVDLLDLFYWEHRLGSWLAQGILEWDLVSQDGFSPYNHRGLLELMLSVPVRYRSAPDYPLQRAMIRRLWPELLKFPINPSGSWRQHAKNRLRRWAKWTGLYPRPIVSGA